MKIRSINIATEQSIEFNGKSVKTGIFKTPTDRPIEVNTRGLVGDTVVDQEVHGGGDQALYLYQKEDYDWWAEELGRTLDFGTFGENLTIEGGVPADWVIGDRLFIGEVILEISAPRAPCFKLGVKMGDSGFVKHFIRACRPGAYARVINGGMVAPGDTISVQKTEENYASVKEVFIEWHRKDKSREIIDKALTSPLASVHRDRLQKWRADAN